MKRTFICKRYFIPAMIIAAFMLLFFAKNMPITYAADSPKTSVIPFDEETEGPAETVSEDFPKTYESDTGSVTVIREKYSNSTVYAAHLVFSDYSRFGAFTGASTVSEANSILGAVLCVNGDYSSACGYVRARTGTVLKDGTCYAEGAYNANNGILYFGGEGSSIGGSSMSYLISADLITDTFQFGPAFLRDGDIYCGSDGSLRPRTFIGTNGEPGDIWVVVAEGDYADGESAGLTPYECAEYLQKIGCTFGVPLDGGGSSEMIFQGEILNHPSDGCERSGLNDFVFFK